MTEPIKFTIGEITYAYGWTFLGCLGLAIVVVFFFSMTKFNESTIAKDEDDLISQLLPRFLATSEQYSRALMIYLAAMSAIVVVLSLLGPRVAYLGAVNLPDAALGPVKLPDAPDVLPLIIALVMVGMLPNVPWLQELERQLRRFAHERAFIPTTARATAERLATAEFDFSSYEADDVLGSCAMRGVERTDFVAPRDSIEYSWARLSCLLHHVRKIQNADAVVSLDNEMLTRYAQDLESLALKRKTMQGDIAQYRQEKAKDRYYSNDDLHRSIRKTLRKVYVLLGCAVRLKFNTDDAMNPALRSFGFLMDTQMAKSDNNNVIIVGLGVMTVSIFAIVYAAAELGALARGFEDLGRFWTPSASFPQDAYYALQMAFSALLAHGTAIHVAEWMRCRRMARGVWFTPERLGRRNVANYLRVATACAVAGFVVLYLWSLLQTGLSWNLATALAPYTLLWATTGAAYVAHLDNVELNERPSRWQEIGLQALAMAVCGVVAANGSHEDIDFIILVAAFGAAIGASLAWYIPAAAARQKYDPLAEAMEQRVSALKAEARRNHKNAAAIDRWLDRPNSKLNYQPPRKAVAELALFEKAMSLLQNAKAGGRAKVCAATNSAGSFRKSSAPVSDSAEPAKRRVQRGKSARQSIARNSRAAEASTTSRNKSRGPRA